MIIGWCGDFGGDWNGLKLQIDNIYRSAQYGYGAIGCEVGGFWEDRCDALQLTRYAQFGCMTACMINGGMNGALTNHLPWYHGEATVEAYRWCVAWMKELTPYKFSALVDAHLEGGSLLRQTNLDEESHLLGNDIFTKAITTADGQVTFTLPEDGEWIDLWTGEAYQGGSVLTKTYATNQFPLFVRAGAIIPLQAVKGAHALCDDAMEGKRVFAIFPKGRSMRRFHLPKDEGTDYFDCAVTYDEASGQLDVDSETEIETFKLIIKKQ